MKNSMRKKIAAERTAWLNGLPVWQTVVVTPIPHSLELLHGRMHSAVVEYLGLQDRSLPGEASEVRFVKFIIRDLVHYKDDFVPITSVRAAGVECGLRPLSVADVLALAIKLHGHAPKFCYRMAMQEYREPLDRLVLDEIGIGAGGYMGCDSYRNDDIIVFKLP